jgi:hypothetical protein
VTYRGRNLATDLHGFSVSSPPSVCKVQADAVSPTSEIVKGAWVAGRSVTLAHARTPDDKDAMQWRARVYSQMAPGFLEHAHLGHNLDLSTFRWGSDQQPKR